jgi:DnaD/phage-associated family protein
VPFAGFPAGKVRLTPIPAQFFSELLPEIDHLGELKVCLYAIWFMDRLEETVRYITHADFEADARLLEGLGSGGLDDALERAVHRGTLLRVLAQGSPLQDSVYFLNSPRGRAAVQAIERGEWAPSGRQHPEVSLEMERPNIFRLYEQNIGPLTPLIAEMLQDAEQIYPQSWFDEVFKIAVEKNVRKWNYIQAILKSWQEEGRDSTDRRNAPQDRRKYVEGEFSDFIKH